MRIPYLLSSQEIGYSIGLGIKRIKTMNPFQKSKIRIKICKLWNRKEYLKEIVKKMGIILLYK